MERRYLNVPYREKDAARVMGARWNPLARKWWIPAHYGLDAFSKWSPGDITRDELTKATVVIDFSHPELSWSEWERYDGALGIASERHTEGCTF